MSGLTVTAEAGIDVVALELRELEVTAPRDDFTPVIERAVGLAREGRLPALDAARAFYRRFRIDPTKTRPSSEALFRRAVRGEPFPRVNSLVDVANVMSLLAQVPIGLYDLGATEGPLNVRVGAEGEGYDGIRKDRVNVAGRICVADALGPCGNPTSDSARTMITTDTERAAWIWFMPVSEVIVDQSAELVAEYGRGLVSLVFP